MTADQLLHQPDTEVLGCIVEQPIARHIYPGAGSRGGIRPGDVAYCGYVKKHPEPSGPMLAPTAAECVVCVDMCRAAGRYRSYA